MRKTEIEKKMNKEYSNLPEHDSPPSDIVLKLFYANENLQQAQIDVIIKQISHKRNKIFQRSDLNELKSNKRALRKLFLADNKIVKENISSTFRFVEKIKEKTYEQILLNHQIEQTNKELEYYPELKQEMESKVEEYTDTYVMFLESVVQSSPEFNSIQNVLNWYETLENCRRDCNQLLREELDEASHLKQEVLQLTEVKSDELRKLENALVMLGVRRKQAIEQRRQWENILGRMKNVMSSKTSDSVTLQTGCYDLYCEICSRRNTKPTVPKEDIKGQLQYIEKSIVFFKEVNRIATTARQTQDEQELKHGKPASISEIMRHVLQASEHERHCQSTEPDNQPRRLTPKQFRESDRY